MTATCRPALLQRAATTDAADPVPITTTSNFLVILSSGSSAAILGERLLRFVCAIAASDPKHSRAR